MVKEGTDWCPLTLGVAIHTVLVVLVAQHLRQQCMALLLDEFGPFSLLATTSGSGGARHGSRTGHYTGRPDSSPTTIIDRRKLSGEAVGGLTPFPTVASVATHAKKILLAAEGAEMLYLLMDDIEHQEQRGSKISNSQFVLFLLNSELGFEKER